MRIHLVISYKQEIHHRHNKKRGQAYELCGAAFRELGLTLLDLRLVLLLDEQLLLLAEFLQLALAVNALLCGARESL